MKLGGGGVFVGGNGSQLRMRPRRCGGWRRGHHQGGTYLSLYWTCLGVGGGGLVICFCMNSELSMRHTLFVVGGDSVGGAALCWLQRRRQKGNLAQIVRKCNVERVKDKRQS